MDTLCLSFSLSLSSFSLSLSPVQLVAGAAPTSQSFFLVRKSLLLLLLLLSLVRTDC